MTRGDVYWATPSSRSGSEQAGRRPVIVVSRDAFNRAAGWRYSTSRSVREASRSRTTL
jgi:mRNA-degrading endonuclease toxin of MazEF toxin-antitoxin module